MKHRIVVTQEDIDKGEKLECSSCPIALAMKRVIKCKSVFVASATATVCWSGFNTETSKLPTRAGLFVRNFDGGMKVKPFVFSVNTKKVKYA